MLHAALTEMNVSDPDPCLGAVSSACLRDECCTDTKRWDMLLMLLEFKSLSLRDDDLMSCVQGLARNSIKY